MYGKKQRSSLESQLYCSFFLISALVILLSLGITLYYDINRQRREIDSVISGTASYIAAMPDVALMLRDGYPSPAVRQDIDSLCANLPDISVVLICDQNGLRFYHTDRLKTGDTFVDGDETAILSGNAPYITTGYGTKGSQRRAFHAVQNGDGRIIGFVMASVFTARISDRQKDIIFVHLAILALMLFVSLSLTHATVHFLKKSLMGFHPDELLDRYLRQDEVLNAVEEGLIATGTDGTILFSNLVARGLFSGDKAPLRGKKLKEIYPATRLDEILKNGRSGHGKSCVMEERTILAREIPIRGNGKKPIQGILTVLYDKTEMLSLADELSGTRNMLDTLRAFNHEFLNKLHVILGYLQTGDTKKATDFIINSSLVSSESIRLTADRIRVSQICALVIGKMMHAAELGILLSLSSDSRCLEKDLLLPVDSCVTVVGNLLENAIEELSGDKREIREIKLGLYCRPDCNIITCEDTGFGIPEKLLSRILEKGVSTKGENRGTGLYLIKQAAAEYNGELSIESEEGEGTCFTLTFARKEEN